MIFEKIAMQNNTTPEEVQKEICAALEAAGLGDVDPLLFIQTVAAIVKSE